MASNGPPNAPRGPRNFNPPSGSLPNGLASSRYATPAPTVQAPAQPRGPQPAQRPVQTRPQATARPGAVLVQSAGPAQAYHQAVAASVQNRAQFIPPPPAAVGAVAALVPSPAQLISRPPQAVSVLSDIESLKIRLEQAESAKKALEKQLDERDGALKSAQKTQIDMAKMLGERKGEIDNAKWQIEELEIAQAELERDLAKKRLAKTSDERSAAQAALDKKALEDMIRQKEESARRAEKEIADAKAHTKSAEERAVSAERRIFEAQGQVQTLTTELSSQKRLVTQAQHEVVELRSKVEDQKKLYSEAKNEASHLKGDLNSLGATVDELEASNSACTAQIATLEQDKQTMTAEMTKLTKRFNDALHPANAAKKEIEDQKAAVPIKSIASIESIAVVAPEQVEETKAEDRESISVIIARPEHRAKCKTPPLQKWLAILVVFLALVATLHLIPTALGVKMFSQNHALTENFFHQEQNQYIAKNEPTWTFLPRSEPTPEITATANESQGTDNVEDFDTISGNTTSPALPAPGDTASELTSLDRIMNWVTDNPYKFAGWVTVCFSGGAAYYSYEHSAHYQ